MSGEITVHIDYRVAAGGEMRVSHDELRARGVPMEDWQAVERAVGDITRERIDSGMFDPFRDWTEYNDGDLEILDIAPGRVDLEWDDLTAEEQARVER